MIRDYAMRKFKKNKRLREAMQKGSVDCTVNLGLYTRIHTTAEGAVSIESFKDFTAIVEFFEESSSTDGLRDTP